MKGSIAVLMMLVSTACMGQTNELDSSSQQYLQAATRFPTYFGITSGEFQEIWNRVMPWLVDQAGSVIFVISDEEIRTTPTPTASGNPCVYRVTNADTFGGVRINVEVLCQNSDTSGEAQRNAHLLSYHLASGLPTPPSLISR